MTNDDALRSIAVVAAVAIVAAPYWQKVAAVVSAVIAAAKDNATTLGRVSAAALIIAAAWGKVPMPTLPAALPAISVETPSVTLQQAVQPVAASLQSLPSSDKYLWASIWSQAAVVADNDGLGETAVLNDTKTLRLFTVLCLDIAWRRIGNHAPGSVTGLREAVERALSATLGVEDVPVTPQMRSSYAEACRAIAWAAVSGS